MPFRARAKAIFRRDKSSALTSSKTTSSSSSSTDRWPSNVYKPGEVMPRPKYRKPPTKEHKETLEAFSFAEAWRRKSFQSVYSPMGTRAPSRKNSSRGPSRRVSFVSRKSYSKAGGGGQPEARSRRASVTSAGLQAEGGEAPGVEMGKVGREEREERGHFAALAPSLSTEEEAEGDDDVHNVGLSRVQSYDQQQRPPPLPASSTMPISPSTITAETAENTKPNAGYFPSPTVPTTAHDHMPFSEHDLTLALQRSHLVVPPA
ncbi:hypothetical protein LTR62_005824 [Meristemomyces frigidus]|uniref:Uncharacterized protein n=1 Tax=Meristemomyces frigidus TaxID=1508187 RepID=A0AAN7TDN1_9PEZI|nr:hypothetical protein LTR62_005824 [Meristemomyces frigidus]